MRLVCATLVAATILAGCPTPSHVKPTPFPAEVFDPEGFEEFPLSVGAYRRGRILRYAPGMSNYSVAYDRLDADLQHVVTLFYYPRASRMDEQYTAEKLGVLRAYPGAAFLSEERKLLWKDGYSFDAFFAVFEFDASLAGKDQRIRSWLILAALPDRSFKVRSSAPAAQASAADIGTLELLERLPWWAHARSIQR